MTQKNIILFDPVIDRGIGDSLHYVQKTLNVAASLGFGARYPEWLMEQRTGCKNVKQLLGLDLDYYDEQAAKKAKRISLEEMLKISRGGEVIDQDLFISLNDHDPSNQSIFQSVKIRNRLKDQLRRSLVWKEAQAIRAKVKRRGREIVLVHVRRGDVALIEPRMLSRLDVDSQGRHFSVKLNRFISKTELPPSVSRRLFSAKRYQEVLVNCTNEKSLVVVTSDGYSQSAALLAQHTDKKYADIIKTLNKDIEFEQAECCILGESPKTLKRTIVAFLAADKIITGFSSLRSICKFAEADTEFVEL